jgi:hypothetical protein
MSRIAFLFAGLLLLAAGPAAAGGTTPPGLWLKAIKDELRQQLHNPKYVAFSRIFYVETKTTEGGMPVCGFVATRQSHSAAYGQKQPFFGLLTATDAAKPASFGSVEIGATSKQAADIAATCSKYGLD